MTMHATNISPEATSKCTRVWSQMRPGPVFIYQAAHLEMDMDHSALHPLVLQLLNPQQPAAAALHPEQDVLAAITVSGATYHVTSAEADLVLSQNGDGDETDGSGNTTQAARLILTLHPASSPDPALVEETPATGAQVAAHVLVRHRAQDSQTPEVELILDSDALAWHDDPGAGAGAGAGGVPAPARPPTPQRASAIVPGHPPERSPSPSSSSSAAATAAAAAAAEGEEEQHRSPSLAETYRAYIAAINARSMARSLPRFCLPAVAHNGRALALADYRGLMEDAQAAIPDITFGVSDLLVDEGRGLVGARLEFRGTPAGEFAGVRPPIVKEDGERGDVDGGEVRFSEVVFYWFERGRIREVVSLVDVDGYRAQLRG